MFNFRRWQSPWFISWIRPWHLFYRTPPGDCFWACGNESHEKETEHSHTSAADLLRIRIRNLDYCKCGHCINEVREMHCFHCREVDAMLIVLARILEHEGSVSPPSFNGHPPRLSRWVLLFATGLAERNEEAGWI